jgi:hypothetical protein
MKSGRTVLAMPTKGKLPRRGSSGRVCRLDGCTTVLSIYNALDDCSVHEGRTLKMAIRPRA